MPQTRRSGPRPGSRPDTTIEPQGNRRAASLPTARALLLPRAGRRGMDAAVVMRCPLCRRSHLHRGYRLDGAVRKSGCRSSREYILVVRL